jgi:hypothetical protein
MPRASQIERDPFARASLMREKCEQGKECAWCGQPARFVYYWEQDSVARSTRFAQAKPFCSVSCFRDYHS